MLAPGSLQPARWRVKAQRPGAAPVVKLPAVDSKRTDASRDDGTPDISPEMLTDNGSVWQPGVSTTVQQQQQRAAAIIDSPTAEDQHQPSPSSSSRSASPDQQARLFHDFVPAVVHAHEYTSHSVHRGASSPEYDEPGDTAYMTLHPSELKAAKNKLTARGFVKPHSGLEAQEAADYEARLDAADAHAAYVAANRSSQSSDDEDAGGDSEIARAIQSQQQRAALNTSRSRTSKNSASRAKTQIAAMPGNHAAGKSDLNANRQSPESTVKQPGSSTSQGDISQSASPDDMDPLSNPLLLAAALAPETEEEDAEKLLLDAMKPNRFLEVPEPLDPEAVAFAATVLKRAEPKSHTDQAMGDLSPTNSIDELVGQLGAVADAELKNHGGMHGNAVPKDDSNFESDNVTPDSKALGMETEDEELCDALGLPRPAELAAKGDAIEFVKEKKASEVL